MAMFGTLVLEDMALNFQITMPNLDNPPVVVYTVVNNFDGSAETVQCTQAAWEAALILHALGSEEKFGIDYAEVNVEHSTRWPRRRVRWRPATSAWPWA